VYHHSNGFSADIFNLGVKLPRTQRAPTLQEEGLQIVLALFEKVVPFGRVCSR